MIGLIQRVADAEVWVGSERISKIGKGILLLVGIGRDDDPKDCEYIAHKTMNLRIFSDEEGNLNRSLVDERGEILVVSQFTLLGDTRKGRRPSFSKAAAPDDALTLYRLLIEGLKKYGVAVAEGRFRAMMDVKLTNQGPVTLIIGSKEKKWN